jgi:hypothetical protein
MIGLDVAYGLKSLLVVLRRLGWRSYSKVKVHAYHVVSIPTVRRYIH